ncbi:MAG: DAK2 domain-containing protein [Lachnospiraceae bacterium]|nr:DAK2 domain-containing protein [Lachnospiraceae bacterium]
MSTTKINAETLAKLFLAGAHALDTKKEWINELNVFPVPDGDTGTNMTMTILSAASEIMALNNPDMKAVCKAISSGSLRGARGNSGVILSQLLRGFTKVVSNYEEIDAAVLSDAFEKAVETAYKAVMKPKEGTILTVAKGACDKAVAMATTTDDLEVICKAVIEEAKAVLKRTPDMLPVLKQAGVVDSGGQGLVVVLEGAFDALMGKEFTGFDSESMPAPSVKIEKISIPDSSEDIKFGYCTEYIILLENPVPDEEVLAYKEWLNNIGDSIVVVADDDLIKTHVHTNEPGTVIQKALTYGQLTKMKIDNMRLEHEERLIKNASEIAARERAEKAAAEAAPVELKKFGFISISAGEGLDEIFKGLGVDEIISGGQTMNPSTEDILAAVKKVNAGNIFILPNNSNIIMAANQASQLEEEKHVHVIPTKTIPQGISALVNFMDYESVETNIENMTAGLSEVKSGEITYAVRDTVINDIEVKENDFMAIGDGGLMASTTDITETMDKCLEAMVDDMSGLISIYFGADVSEDDANAMCDHVSEKYPDLDVELNYGGQPVYYYLISVE